MDSLTKVMEFNAVTGPVLSFEQPTGTLPLVATTLLKAQPFGKGLNGALASAWAPLRNSSTRILMSEWLETIYPYGPNHMGVGKQNSHLGSYPENWKGFIRRMSIELGECFHESYDQDRLKELTGFRISHFPDGGGKIRSIGIGN
jgi:hypothetical protein